MNTPSKYDVTIDTRSSRPPKKASVIPSKSELHRLLIASALSDKPTRIDCSRQMRSEDIDATASCLSALGAKISFFDTYIDVAPIEALPSSRVLLDCGESGSTLRFMLPIVSALGVSAVFTGSGRLPERPLGDLVDEMISHGAVFSSRKLPFELSGKLTGGNFALSGKVSSQYVTGLILALSTLSEPSEIQLTSPLESRAYVDITCDVLSKFGVNIQKSENSYKISGKDNFSSPKNISASGDWSNAAFFLVSGALFSPIDITNLDICSSQGDKKILDILRDFGAKVELSDSSVKVSPHKMEPISVNLEQIPDMLPALAVLASFANGESRFYGGARLRLKESDRITSVANMVKALGGEAEELPDGLIIRGKKLCGGVVDGCGDHRIVMASTVMSLGCENDVTILGANAVKKSYPTFFEEFGAKITRS